MKNIGLLIFIVCGFFISCKQKSRVNYQKNNKIYHLINPNSSYSGIINKRKVNLNIQKNNDSIFAVLFYPNDENAHNSKVVLRGFQSDSLLQLSNISGEISLSSEIDDSILTAIYKDSNTQSKENITLTLNSLNYSNGNLQIKSSNSDFIKDISLVGAEKNDLILGELFILKQEPTSFLLLFQYPSLGVFKATGTCGMGVELLLVEIAIGRDEKINTKYTELVSCNNSVEASVNDKVVFLEDIKRIWQKNKNIILERTELKKDKTELITIK